MVKQIPLDYMHVVLLGVMKKMLRMWIGGDLNSLLPTRDVQKISERLISISTTQPSEFQRTIRGLNEIGHFKATEFRTFVLYAGPFVLKNILPREQYNHFLLLHLAIYILCDKFLYLKHTSLAENMLRKFVEKFSEIYGEKHMIYNVHSLLHLTNDCRNFGPLDTFSAFPFESFNYQLLRLLHKHNTSLSEVSNRITEINLSSYCRDVSKGSNTLIQLLRKFMNEVLKVFIVK